MRLTTQGSSPVHTIFGSGYVPEQRGDETHGHLAPRDDDRFAVDFSEILNALRAALSLR